MDQLKDSIDTLVSAGIRAYIGLLGYGERDRSKRLFMDTLELSALMSGGPSAKVGPLLDASDGAFDSESRPFLACLILLTLRSLLATLLVLKTSHYWNRLPALEELRDQCGTVADILDVDAPVQTSGRTASALNSCGCHETGANCGCRRSSALPLQPELEGLATLN